MSFFRYKYDNNKISRLMLSKYEMIFENGFKRNMRSLKTSVSWTRHLLTARQSNYIMMLLMRWNYFLIDHKCYNVAKLHNITLVFISNINCFLLNNTIDFDFFGSKYLSRCRRQVSFVLGQAYIFPLHWWWLINAFYN